MKSLRIVLSIFLVIGILLLLGSGALVIHTERFLSTAVQTQGTVTALISHAGSRGNSYTYNPQFTFHTQDGRTITVISNSGSNPPAFSEGDPVTVLYQPAHPQSARIDSFSQLWIAPLILGILGFVFTGFGCIIWLVSGRGAVLQKRLIGKGQQVTANVTGVELDSSLEVNGRFPWRIAAQWQDPTTSKVYVFRSDRLWYDPTQWLPTTKTVSVWITPGKPEVYAMDTSFLPPRGND